MRHERDGYFIGLEQEETKQINAADCGYRGRLLATVVENGSDDDDGMGPELFGEITPRGVEQLFGSFGRLPKGFVFFDLGSGVGKMATQVAIVAVVIAGNEELTVRGSCGKVRNEHGT